MMVVILTALFVTRMIFQHVAGLALLFSPDALHSALNDQFGHQFTITLLVAGASNLILDFTPNVRSNRDFRSKSCR